MQGKSVHGYPVNSYNCKDSVLLSNCDLKNIQNICIRAGKPKISGLRQRECSSVSEDVNIGKACVQSHRTEPVSVSVKVETVPDFVPVMTAAGSFLFNKRKSDLWSFHMKLLPYKVKE